MKFSPEFKKAISELPSAEKDKLLFRLLKRDLDLANQLLFELVDTDSVEDKREIIVNEMTKFISKGSEHFYSPGYLLMDVRYASGNISQHVKITKDKFGEPYLNLLLLILTLERNLLMLNKESFKDTYTLNVYIVARVFKILTQIKALHEDYHIEFKNLLEKLENLFPKFPNLMKVAINNGLDINWLTYNDIPNDIAAIQKELRANGFLK